MPPTALYILGLIIWVPSAALIWVASFLMIFTRRTRPFAWPTALAMAATFPGVFLFQIIAVPMIFALAAPAVLLRTTLEPSLPEMTTNLVVIIANIVAAFGALGIMLGMSVLGFCEGWLVGWWCAQGQGLHEVTGRGPSVLIMRTIFRRFRPGMVTPTS